MRIYLPKQGEEYFPTGFHVNLRELTDHELACIHEGKHCLSESDKRVFEMFSKEYGVFYPPNVYLSSGY